MILDMDTMTNLIQENFKLHATRIPSLNSSMIVKEVGGFVYVNSGLPCDTFNIIHLFDGENVKEQDLRTCLETFKNQKKVYCLWISEENLTPNINAILSRLSISIQNEEIGMVLDLDHYVPANDDDHSNIREVRNTEELEIYASTIAKNWTPRDENVIKYYSITFEDYLNSKNGVSLFVYYHDEIPVSTVELFATDNKTVGLYGFSTLSAYRGLGIGTKLLSFTLNRVKAFGYQHTILQATNEGIGIYKRYGFREFSTYYEFN